MDSTPLEGHGQHHHFFTPHHSIILSSLELLQRKIVLSPQHTQAGWNIPPAIFIQATPLTWTSLKCLPLEQRRDQNTLHHSGTLHSSAGRSRSTHLYGLSWFQSLSRVSLPLGRIGVQRMENGSTKSISLLGGLCRLSINLL